MGVEVLYVDNHHLVLNKPAGLLTQPSGTQEDSLEAQAKEWIKKTYQKPGNVFLEAIHRLDRPVSGVVVFARTSKALSRLNTYIRNKETKKIYYALVEGCPQLKEGRLEHYLVHESHQAKKSTRLDSSAKLAILSYKTIDIQGKNALLEIELETGRYHQIRCQLALIGCPIKGDKKYGAISALDGERIGLHHVSFQIPHPITHEIQIFEAPVLNLREEWLA